MARRFVTSRNPLVRGQLVFDFYKPEAKRLIREAESRKKKRAKKSERRRLQILFDTDCTDIPTETLCQLDELIRQRVLEVRAKWTAVDAAAREGIDTSRLNQLVLHDGRYHESTVRTATLSDEYDLD